MFWKLSNVTSYIFIFFSCPNAILLDHKQDIFNRLVEFEINSYYYLNICCSNGSIPTMSKQSIATVSPSSRTDEEDEMGYETDFRTENTDIDINTNTSNWSTTDRKKLQHMTEFHTEYQCVFGEGASIRTIMK